MDFESANQLAERISRGENGCLLQRLIQLCTPYLLYVKRRFGFHRISCKEVVEELASDAVSDTIAIKQYKKLPFTICLQNEFRNRCRQIYRIRREQAIDELEALFDVSNTRPTIRIGAKWPSPEIQAQRNEERELFHKELENHGKLSKRVIYLRLSGSSYEEIAEICGKTPGQLRSIYRYYCDKIRNILRRRHVKEDDFK